MLAVFADVCNIQGYIIAGEQEQLVRNLRIRARERQLLPLYYESIAEYYQTIQSHPQLLICTSIFLSYHHCPYLQ